MASPLQNPKVIEHWSQTAWIVGAPVPALFGVCTYLTVHRSQAGPIAVMAGLAVAVVVFALEHGYVLHTGGKPAEILGHLGDVACLTVPWMPLTGFQPAVLIWVAGSSVVLVAVGAGRFTPRPGHVLVGTPVSVAVAWGASRVLGWASHLTTPTVPGVPAVGIPFDGWVLRGLAAVAAACAVGAVSWWALRRSARRRPSLPRQMRGDTLDEFLGTVRLRRVDGPTRIPGHEDPTRMQSLYALPRSFGDVRLLVTHNGTKNPATDVYEAVGLRASLACSTAMEAAGETYGQSGAEYALTERRT